MYSYTNPEIPPVQDPAGGLDMYDRMGGDQGGKGRASTMKICLECLRSSECKRGDKRLRMLLSENSYDVVLAEYCDWRGPNCGDTPPRSLRREDGDQPGATVVHIPREATDGE